MRIPGEYFAATLLLASVMACCPALADVSIDEAYGIAGRAAGKSMTLVRESDVKVAGEDCYMIAAGENSDAKLTILERYAVGQKSGKLYLYDIVMDDFQPVETVEER